MKISLVVAMARNRVIGRNNELPWYLPEDLKYFKSVTMGKPIIMGRKTWASIGRPLPGRTNIVVTSRTDWRPEGVLVAHSLADAVQLSQQIAQRDGVEEAMVVGGGEIYRQALPLANRIYLTEVGAEVEGDAYFPVVDLLSWREVKRQTGIGGDYPYAFVIFERVKTNR